MKDSRRSGSTPSLARRGEAGSLLARSRGGHGKRVIEAEGLSKSFGGRVLFADSSFSILRGEHIAVWGPNGCGKSTLLKILLGSDTPDSGRIRMNGSLHPFVLEQTFAGFAEDRTALSWLTETVNGISGADRARLMHMGLTTELLMQPLKTLSFGGSRSR
jgi:macrolide transport system ATP-binding/permease protein